MCNILTPCWPIEIIITNIFIHLSSAAAATEQFRAGLSHVFDLDKVLALEEDGVGYISYTDEVRNYSLFRCVIEDNTAYF